MLLLPSQLCSCHIVKLNTASAPVHGASTMTFLFHFVVSHQMFPELEFFPVPPLKLNNSTLPSCYGCAQLTDKHYLFLSAPCKSYSLSQRPYSPNLTGGDLVWCFIIGNITEVITFAVIQTITSVSRRE